MTARVRLRTPTRGDLPTIRALWTHAATMAPVGGIVTFSDEEAERWFRRKIDPGSVTDRYFLIDDERGLPVGEISVSRFDPSRWSGALNVKVHADHRGRGLGHAAMEAFLTWYFEELGAREITDDLALGNDGGRRLMEDFGFVHDPSFTDVHMMRLDRAAWQARRRR